MFLVKNPRNNLNDTSIKKQAPKDK